jgi:serine/threonine protein kinase
MQGVGDGQEPPPTPAKILKVDGERRYGLGAVLGEGSYGVVREGLELRTLKVVAVKSLDRRMLKKQRRGLENLKREIRVHKLLGSHPTIVSLRETIDIEHKSKLHMVLDYMHCGSVQDVLDRAPNNALGQAQARQYFGGLLLSLEHIHSVGVVHKDVKPANMLLDRLGNVHLSDFGCAEELGRYDAQDTCRQTLGSPAFQSPVSGGECRVPSAFDVSHARCLPYASFSQEIATGKEEFSGYNVDVWAAGVTLYQMVVGRTPFTADNLLDLYERIGEAKVVVPPTLGDELSDLLLQILCPSQERRISKEQIRKHAWMALDMDSEPERGLLVERKPTIMDYDFLDDSPEPQPEPAFEPEPRAEADVPTRGVMAPVPRESGGSLRSLYSEQGPPAGAQGAPLLHRDKVSPSATTPDGVEQEPAPLIDL